MAVNAAKTGGYQMAEANFLARAMIDDINQARVDAGLNPLKINIELNEAATNHTSWMLENDILGPIGEGNSSPLGRIEATDFPLEGDYLTAENTTFSNLPNGITASSTSEGAIFFAIAGQFKGMMEDVEDRANILNPDFEEIGVGVEIGNFKSGGEEFNAMMTTVNFAATDGDTSAQQEFAPMPEPEVAAAPVMEPVEASAADAASTPDTTSGEPVAKAAGQTAAEVAQAPVSTDTKDADGSALKTTETTSTSAANASSKATVNPNGTVDLNQKAEASPGDGSATAVSGGSGGVGDEAVAKTTVADAASKPATSSSEATVPSASADVEADRLDFSKMLADMKMDDDTDTAAVPASSGTSYDTATVPILPPIDSVADMMDAPVIEAGFVEMM
jgi:uncharacterized protein YkwD